MYNFFKNFIIAFLVVLAVYQTNKLWFEDFSSHNFFYTVLHESFGERQSAGIKSEVSYAACGSGNGRFFLSYSGESADDIKQAVIKAADTALDKGERADYSKGEFESIIKNRCLVLGFGFLLDNGSFSSLYGGGSGETPAFDSVAVGDDSSGTLRVLFFNSESLEGALYLIKGYSDINAIRSLIDKTEPETGGIYYISSVASNYEVFEGSEFIPTWAGEMCFYTVARTDPTESEGDEATALDRYASAYFDNPVLKWTSVEEGVYTFSDENTVVKIYPNDILEYSSYSVSGSGEGADLGERLLAAESFLDCEPNLNNDYYLSGYKNEGDRTVFYFDYKINGYILELSAAMKIKLGMKGLIEVTTDGSRVSRYRRYLRDYQPTIKDPVYTEKSYLEVIDKGLNELNGESVESLRLEYVETGDSGPLFCYHAVIDGKEYIETAF